MKDHIFRQYDIRGKVGSELLLDEVYRLAQAIVYLFQEKNPQIKTIAVGNDGRVHSPAIQKEVCRALQDSGIDVLYIGTCPSPILYYTLHNYPVDAGLMITASHNGPDYNGIKICLGKESVWGADIALLRDYYKAGKKVQPQSRGSYREQKIIPDYISYLKKQFFHLIGFQHNVVVDCGNGAAGTVLPQLVAAFEWPAVTLLYPEVDGTYPHHEADPTVDKNMADVRALLATTDAEFGLGLDGDCDRMAPMTKQGELVSGDKLLALFAQPIIKECGAISVVFDIKCSAGLPELLTAWLATPLISPSGHSIIKKRMKDSSAVLAGELSCHFFFADRYFGYDDGIYAMLRLFELVQQTGKSLDELVAIFPVKYSIPEVRIECALEAQQSIVEEIKNKFSHQEGVDVLTIDGVRVTSQHGWGMVRGSNTQPVLCVRFEGNSPEGLAHIQDDFIAVMRPYFDAALLRESFGV